jgi:transposase
MRGAGKLQTKSLIKRLLKIENVVIRDSYFERVSGEDILIVRIRPFSRQGGRCPLCHKRCPGYDSKNKLRRWRSLDLGSMRVYLESFAPRVRCSEHGVIVADVPWAKHGSDFTNDFEMAVTWLTIHAAATDVSEYFRIKWDTVGSIARRVQKTLESEQASRFDDLSEIGIDETSYKKGHKYMTVVVNHKTGALIWAAKGHGKETLRKFFIELHEEQRAKIKLVSADVARWIADCIKEYCPNAERCIDPFHVVTWANNALDEVRKSVVRTARQEAVSLKTEKNAKKKITPRFKDMPC